MKLNLQNFKQMILQGYFKGNQRQCALALNVSAEFLNKILKKKRNAGALFLGKLKIYCNNNNLNFDNFIILK